MGLFGDNSKEEEREEVTIGLSDEGSEEASEGSVDVGAIDFGNREEKKDDGDLRRQVENKVAGDEEDGDVSLDDLHRQNEEIKRKLDTIISSL